MFVPFSIDKKPIETSEAWVAFVKKTPLAAQADLLDALKLQRNQKKGLPNFTRQADGKTLLAWARENLASYILLQEIKLAAE